MSAANDWISAGAATISAIADIATAGIAFYGFGQLIRSQDKADPQHLSTWTQTWVLEDMTVQIDVFAVNLLPEPAILTALRAPPGLQIAMPVIDNRTIVRRQRDQKAGIVDPTPTWGIVIGLDRVLPGYQPDGKYNSIATILVRRDAVVDWAVDLEVKYAAGSKSSVTRRLHLAGG